MERHACSKCQRLFSKVEGTFINSEFVCTFCQSVLSKGPPAPTPSQPAPAERKSEPIPPPPKKKTEKSSFFKEVPTAFIYQFRGEGILTLIVGTIFFWILELIASLSLFGFIIAFLIGGYLCAYMIKIINESADGKKELSDWPEFTDLWASIISPFFFVINTAVICFGPALLYFFLLMPRGVPPLLLPVLIVLGALYMPMGLLAVSIGGTLRALSPFVVMRSIFRVPGEYIVACLALGLIIFVRMFVSSMVIFIPILGSIIISFLSLYVLTAEMRILGLIYYTCRERLQWS